jgi:formimidoylglutamate deiminase
MRKLRCERWMRGSGWDGPSIFELDEAGRIASITPARGDETVDETIDGLVLPGMPNVHGHAFQRALAGFVEDGDPGAHDSFWTWRTRMYRLALQLAPEDVEAIAAQLYVEALEAGYTSMGEFHYVHHDPEGRPYADRAELAARILAAAAETGVGLCLLPVPYLAGGFDQPPRPEQRRFVHADPDDFLETWAAIRARLAPDQRLGIAPHSLRAVPPEAWAPLLGGVRAVDPDAPIHVHAAEQTAEVEACLGRLGARPVRWLLDTIGVDARWCLVHATHLDGGEIEGLARSEAVVGLCPTTEANLGDGIFPAEAFLRAGGRVAIGSDSHVIVDPAEELRLIEMAQRLITRRRLVLALGPAGTRVHVGAALWRAAARGGAQALGLPAGALEVGHRADLIVLDPSHPHLVAHGPDAAVDALVFAGPRGAIRDVMVAGRWRVRGGRHPAREAVASRYAACLRRCAAAFD